MTQKTAKAKDPTKKHLGDDTRDFRAIDKDAKDIRRRVTALFARDKHVGKAGGDSTARGLWDIRTRDGKLVTSVIAHSAEEAKEKALKEAYMLGMYRDRAPAIQHSVAVRIKDMPRPQPGRAAPATKGKTSRYGGWPLKPSAKGPFKGELTLQCPNCGSQDVMLAVVPAPLGTGPGGRARLGDQGSVDVAICQDCGNRGYLKIPKAKGQALGDAFDMRRAATLEAWRDEIKKDLTKRYDLSAAEADAALRKTKRYVETSFAAEAGRFPGVIARNVYQMRPGALGRVSLGHAKGRRSARRA